MHAEDIVLIILVLDGMGLNASNAIIVVIWNIQASFSFVHYQVGEGARFKGEVHSVTTGLMALPQESLNSIASCILTGVITIMTLAIAIAIVASLAIAIVGAALAPGALSSNLPAQGRPESIIRIQRIQL